MKDPKAMLMSAAQKVDQLLGNPSHTEPAGAEEPGGAPEAEGEAEDGGEALGLDRLIALLLPKIAAAYPETSKYPPAVLLGVLRDMLQEQAPMPLASAMGLITGDYQGFLKRLDMRMRTQKLVASAKGMK